MSFFLLYYGTERVFDKKIIDSSYSFIICLYNRTSVYLPSLMRALSLSCVKRRPPLDGRWWTECRWEGEATVAWVFSSKQMPFFLKLVISTLSFVSATCHASMYWTGINGGILNGAKLHSTIKRCNLLVANVFFFWRIVGNVWRPLSFCFVCLLVFFPRLSHSVFFASKT